MNPLLSPEILKAIDTAARGSDRWWVVALFALLIIFIIASGKWLVKKHEKIIDQQREDQMRYENKLETIIDRQNGTQEKLSVVLSNCACALEDNTDALRRNTEKLNQP